MMKDQKILGKRPLFRPSSKDLPTAGTIKLSQIKAEFGKGNNLLNYLGEGGVTSSAPLKLTDFYGKSSAPNLIDINIGGYPEVSRQFGTDYGAWYSGSRYEVALGTQYYTNGYVFSTSGHKLKSGNRYRVDFEWKIDQSRYQVGDFEIQVGLYNGDYTTEPKTEYSPSKSGSYLNSAFNLYTNRRADAEWYPGAEGVYDTGRIYHNSSMQKVNSGTGLISGQPNSGGGGGTATLHFSSYVSSWSPGNGTLGIACTVNGQPNGSGIRFTMQKLKLTKI
jgi:hypothetical protein